MRQGSLRNIWNIAETKEWIPSQKIISMISREGSCRRLPAEHLQMIIFHYVQSFTGMNSFVKIIFCLFSLSISIEGMSQKKKYTFEEIAPLSKDSIISIAESYISQKDFSRKNFDLVTIRKVDKPTEAHLYVMFKPSVLFFSGRYLFYSSVTVDLITGSLSHSIEEKGKRYKWEAPYYCASREAKKAIRFISKAAAKDGGVISPEKAGKVYAIEIYERTLYYHLDIHSSSTYGYYRVHKLTGKVYHKGHKHKMISDDDNE